MQHRTIGFLIAITTAALTGAAHAGVTAAEAGQLGKDLTPLGAERAANKDGSILAWTRGYTTPMAGFTKGGRRGDPFAADKPLFVITAKNLAQYADRLSDGTKAMFAKYPESFRVDVYRTLRTAAAPQWVYDATLKNATTARLVSDVPTDAFGGIPFPIPKDAREIMSNHDLRWRGEAFQNDFRAYMTTADGQHVMTNEGVADIQLPYYAQGAADKFNGEFWLFRLISTGPSLRAGEGLVARVSVDPDKTQAWVYLTGQRRTRKLSNPCCDTPSPVSAGIMSIDEINVWSGRLDRFDWTIVGKQEMFIPYNSNRSNVPPQDFDLIGKHHLNPDHVRWELHRVWVIEAKLKAGQRHQAAHIRYYVDEDTWNAVLGDRWDAKGQLWKTLWALPSVVPDLRATTPLEAFGFYDLLSGAWYANSLINSRTAQYKIIPRLPDRHFSPESLTGEGVR